MILPPSFGAGSMPWASAPPDASPAASVRRPTSRMRRSRSTSMPASTVGLCVRACREVQMNDVIGMAYRGHGAKVVFDFDNGMGHSTCVACGECVQVCPTGALMEKEPARRHRQARELRNPLGRHAVPLLRSGLPDHECTSRTTRSSTSTAATDRPMKIGCASRAASDLTTSTIPTD